MAWHNVYGFQSRWITTPNRKRSRARSNSGTPAVLSSYFNIQGHDGEVRQTAWRPDAQQWVTVGNDGKIKLWDASSGQEIHTLRGHTAQVKSVAWNTDGSLLATGDASGAVKLWNPAQTQESIVLEGRRLAAWSPDGTRLATGGQELGSVDVDSPDKYAARLISTTRIPGNQ